MMIAKLEKTQTNVQQNIEFTESNNQQHEQQQNGRSLNCNCVDAQQKVRVGMCAHRRFRSACASAQSDPSLRWTFYGSQWSNVSSGGKLRL